MKVLLLSPFFHPERISTGRYNTILAEHLVQRGASVDVLVSHPLYPAWRPVRSDTGLPGMRITRGGSWLRYPSRPILRRLILELWYAIYSNLRVLGMRRRPSLVVAILPPNLFVLGLRLILPRRTPLVGIVHDLQGVMARPGNSPAARILMRAIQAVERRVLASCDRLVFLSNSMATRAIAEYGLDRRQCAVNYPFVTLRPVGSVTGGNLAAELPPGYCHVVYSGALGEKQDPQRLVELMTRLSGCSPEVRCHVFSAGPIFDQLRAAASCNPRSRVTFHDLVADELLAELYQRSTIQLIPQAAGTSDGAMPSKLPNLLAAGVPVFAICDADSEIVHLLRTFGPHAGDFAEGFNAPDIDQRFLSLLDRVGMEPRAARAVRFGPLVARLFGADQLVTYILSSSAP